MPDSYDLQALKAVYDQDGVVKVPGLVDHAWVARLTDVLTDFLKDDPGEGNSVNFGHGPGRTTVRWMWRERDEVLQFARESGIAPTVAAIIGTTRLRFWYDNTFIQDSGFKGAVRSGSPYHSDSSAFPFTGEQNPSVWVALTPVTHESAPLTCLRGSHRTGLRYRPPVGVDKDTPLPEGFVEQPDWDAAVAAGEWQRVSFEMDPGDTLIIHPATIHGAPPAEDGAPRRIGFTSRWAGDDVRWNVHDYAMRIPDIDYEDVTEGEPVGGAYFPEVWSSQEQ